ncbi:MAG: fused MFS/spermidine synthase [Chloroflexota bacterium]
MTDSRGRNVVIAAFILSGAAGLMYEVVWARQLVLVFGNTTQATAAILTGFFGGMALGAFFGGRLADRVPSPLLLYAAVEIAVAAVAVCTPVLFGSIREGYRSVYPALSEAPVLLGLVRFGLSLLALAPATILLGSTLPFLTRHLLKSDTGVAIQFGRLYAVNTMGALAGAAIAGYVLIELVGLQTTVWIAASFSLAAGLAAVSLWRRLPAAVPVVRAGSGSPKPGASRQLSRPHPLVLVVAFVSGLTSLGYQVLWTRLMSSGTAASSYVFTTILVMFLTGIATGAYLYGRGTRSERRYGFGALGIAQLLIAAIACAGLQLLGDSGSAALAWIVVILPATMVMGFALPIALGLLGDDEQRAGASSGLLIAVNTAGTVMGTFVVPFLLIPSLGSGHAVLVLATLNALLAAALFSRAPSGNWRLAPTAGVALLAAISLAALPIVNPGFTRSPVDRSVEQLGTLYASAEDEIAAVQAGRVDSVDHLWVAGVSMTGLTVDTKLMPLLPLMAEPEADSALIIAFGMGTSHRAALTAGLTVESVELVPSVVRMFPEFYADAEAVLANPRGRLVVADGRNHVALTTRQYDIVMSDPPPPIRSAGTGVLYAREFYAACASRLTPGGVMMQWMPHDQTLDELKAHMRTFQDVFPVVTYILAPTGKGVFMLGSSDPISLGAEGVRSVLARPGVIEDLTSAPDSPPIDSVDDWTALIASLAWLDNDAAREFAGDGPMITDDRPRTEYFLLRSSFGPSSPLVDHDVLLAETGRHRP